MVEWFILNIGALLHFSLFFMVAPVAKFCNGVQSVGMSPRAFEVIL